MHLPNNSKKHPIFLWFHFAVSLHSHASCFYLSYFLLSNPCFSVLHWFSSRVRTLWCKNPPSNKLFVLSLLCLFIAFLFIIFALLFENDDDNNHNKATSDRPTFILMFSTLHFYNLNLPLAVPDNTTITKYATNLSQIQAVGMGKLFG